MQSFQSKQFIATAYLFLEILAIAGPLRRTLPSIDIDFGNALDLVDFAISQLQELRENPRKVKNIVEKDFDRQIFKWKESRLRKRKGIDGEFAKDERR